MSKSVVITLRTDPLLLASIMSYFINNGVNPVSRSNLVNLALTAFEQALTRQGHTSPFTSVSAAVDYLTHSFGELTTDQKELFKQLQIESITSEMTTSLSDEPKAEIVEDIAEALRRLEEGDK